MILLVAGGRKFGVDSEKDRLALMEALYFLDSFPGFDPNKKGGQPNIDAIVSGAASGADFFGAQWGFANLRDVVEFPADWANLGRVAGPIRNQVMVDFLVDKELAGVYVAALLTPGGSGTEDCRKKLELAEVKYLLLEDVLQMKRDAEAEKDAKVQEDPAEEVDATGILATD